MRIMKGTGMNDMILYDGVQPSMYKVGQDGSEASQDMYCIYYYCPRRISL